MTETSVKQEYTDLLEVMAAADAAYYELDEPILSDPQYDALRARVLEIEAAHPSLISPDSPSQKVSGAATSAFEKTAHRVRMESLDNSFSPAEVAQWAAKNFESGEPLLAELKMDGLSLSLVYEEGKLIRAVTRGDGTIGEDVTHTAREIIDLPLDITDHLAPDDDIIEVRGEVYMTKSDLDINNIALKAQGKKPLANCRNAAAGALRQKDPAVARKRGIRFMAFGVTPDTFDDVASDMECLDILDNMGFDVVPHVVIAASPVAIEKQIAAFEKQRPDLDYDIDGIVWKVDDRGTREDMGSTSRAPRWASAFKFAAEQKAALLMDVRFQVGRTGAITPVAVLSPTNVGGVMVTNATLHNEGEIERLGIQIGDSVMIQRAGDVIPQVVRLIEEGEMGDRHPIHFPRECPACGGPTHRPDDEAVRRCVSGFSCEPQRAAMLKHFVSRDAMNIDGLGPAQITDMIRYLKLESPSHIMILPEATVDQIGEDSGPDFDDMPITEAMENWKGYGKTSIKKLMAAIKKARKVDLDKFIYALGIRNIGQSTSRDIAKELKTADKFFSCVIEEGLFEELCGHIDGIGPTVIDSFERYSEVPENFDEVFALRLACDVQDMPQNLEGPKPLAGEVLCFTGTSERWSRDQCILIAEDLGAETTNSAAKKTTILVAGANVGAKKIEAAEKFGCEIKDPDWFEGIVMGAVMDGYKLEVMD